MHEITSNDLRLCHRVVSSLKDKYQSYSKSTEVLEQSVLNNDRINNRSQLLEGIIIRKRIELTLKELLDDFTKFVENIENIHHLQNV